jgi:NADH:ubiquinone oxidoreductase subunit F (NADH-binding)
MREIYERLVEGKGRKSDIKVLEDLSTTMSLASLCGLGQAVPVPVMDSLNNFRAAYEARIK